MIVCRTLSRLLSNVAMSSPQGRRDISGRSPTKIEADEIDVSPPPWLAKEAERRTPE
jgi:hypothetical protein